ncbi:MAG: F0F1 ATP synthase subunit delta [Pseudomonadales bacterium]|nr:F0F1 ATP synthase subunit delta [Pseudomonadales bacterium]
MAELTTVARPYAKAAFQYADENSSLADWSDMLGFAAGVAQDEAFAGFIADPKTTAADQAEAFIKVGSEKLNEAGQNFIRLLASNKRLTVLPEIASLYEQLKAQKEMSVDVEVTSAFALTDDQANKLAEALKRKLDREITITSQEDKSLIGGVVIRAGDLVLDSSVKGKLAKLAETLNS